MDQTHINDMACRLAMPGILSAEQIRAGFDELLETCGGDANYAKEFLADCDASPLNTAIGAILHSQ
jgi:hypothetical protein